MAYRVYFSDGYTGPYRCNIVYEMLDDRLIKLKDNTRREPIKNGFANLLRNRLLKNALNTYKGEYTRPDARTFSKVIYDLENYESIYFI